MKLIYIILLGLFLNGCNILESQEEKQAKLEQERKILETKLEKSKELELKEIEAKKIKDLAQIEANKELAKIDKAQLLEKIKIEAEIQKEKIPLQIEQEKAILAQKFKQMQLESELEIKRYIFIFSFFVLVVISFFVYYYFKKRHENKLISYQDNLDKYFHQQENLTKMRIAEKIIDTVASGKLNKEQEMELIKAIGSNPKEKTPQIDDKHLLEDIDVTQDVEIIEEKK